MLRHQWIAPAYQRLLGNVQRPPIERGFGWSLLCTGLAPTGVACLDGVLRLETLFPQWHRWDVKGSCLLSFAVAVIETEELVQRAPEQSTHFDRTGMLSFAIRSFDHRGISEHIGRHHGTVPLDNDGP